MTMTEGSLKNPGYDTFIDIIRKRRSVRRFGKGRPISREVLERISEAGRWAPSGANVQPWDFIVVEDPEMRDRVVEVFLRQADRLMKYAKKFRTDGQVQFYFDSLRPFAMYRNKSELGEWEDFEERLGEWQDAFTTDCANPSGRLP